MVPHEDTFTLYLLARKRPDGSFGVFLRNPERDFGGWLGVDRLVREGNAVKLIGKRPGQKAEGDLAAGTYEADNDVITVTFPNRGGTYDFRRDDDQSDLCCRHGIRLLLCIFDGGPRADAVPRASRGANVDPERALAYTPSARKRTRRAAA